MYPLEIFLIEENALKVTQVVWYLKDSILLPYWNPRHGAYIALPT
jgi:hypothetical protein